MKIRFAVMIVCYNAGKELGETLKSLQEQTYTDWSVVIKDGGSKDGSYESVKAGFLLDSTGRTADGRVLFLREKDRGIYDAMNAALDAADKYKMFVHRDTFVYFLNCGDRLDSPETLERVAAGITEHPGADIYYGNLYEEKTHQVVTSNPVIDDFACYRHLPGHQACFYRAELMRKEHFDTKWIVRADYEQFLRCRYIDHAGTCYLPTTIARYEGGGFSETRKNRKLSEKERRVIIRRYLPAAQVRKYDFVRYATLAPIRTWIAGNPVTAGVYNRLKSAIYRNRI